MSGAVSRWLGSVEGLSEIAQRLQRVQIENAPAIEVIQRYDTANTVFCVDLPYVHSSRDDAAAYDYEMTGKDHESIAKVLNCVRGRVALSGYRTDPYDRLYRKWRRIDAAERICHSVRTPRQESAWLNFQTMDNAVARQWLDDAWDCILENDPGEPDSEIDRLANSRGLSIRYAVLTQMMDKITEEHRNLLSLQMGDGETPGAWDARSFCSTGVVPWVADNHGVLGTSPDSYMNNPLRRPRVDAGTEQLRYRAEWNTLVAFLAPWDTASRDELEAAFMRCLASAARQLSSQSFRHEIPVCVSLPQMLHV